MHFKKFLTTISASLSIILSVSIPVSAQTGVVTADTLNIRSSTNTSSEVLAKAFEGDELEILASDGTWYKVLLSNGSHGYVKSEYLTLNESYYGVVTASNLIVRSSTGTNSTAITTLPYGSVVELLAYDGAWYQIKYSNAQTGFVSADYISHDMSLAVTTPYVNYGYIDASSLNIRKTTSTSSDIIASVTSGTKVILLAYDGEWYHVELPDGTQGYASSDYISTTPVINSASSVQENCVYASNSDANTSLGESIVQTAHKYLGAPYVWAAAGPSSFDCSGFTMYVMNVHGIKLPHQSGEQYDCGTPVLKESLIPGDLVFFNSARKSTVAHVGIYIGEGKFIHASSGSAKSVTISSLSDNYYTNHYLGARRVI